MSSRHKVLSVKLMCEYLIPSSSYYIAIAVHKIPLTATTTHNFLFQMKHIVIEEFVEFFICEVDAELLKGVDL